MTGDVELRIRAGGALRALAAVVTERGRGHADPAAVSGATPIYTRLFRELVGDPAVRVRYGGPDAGLVGAALARLGVPGEVLAELDDPDTCYVPVGSAQLRGVALSDDARALLAIAQDVADDGRPWGVALRAACADALADDAMLSDDEKVEVLPELVAALAPQQVDIVVDGELPAGDVARELLEALAAARADDDGPDADVGPDAPDDAGDGGEAWRSTPTSTSVTCPRCGRTSHHPDDVANGYCAGCHDWTSPAQGAEPPRGVGS